ncbi:MAG TPA: family 10 glycosylhydrolase [Syntrophomonadaceae bacterium]|nr:family 10 glycosylhydrolase [Syntrophomonadaceae bacterium]
MLLLLVAMAMPAAASGSNITVFYNGQQKQFDPAPQIINDRVLVPMRDIFEALGAEISWDPKSNTAIAFKDGKYVSVQIGSKVGVMADATVVDGKYQVNNPRNVKLDAAPIIVNSRTMVPLRFVSESLGAEVQWVGNTSQIFIKTGGATAPPANANSEMRGAWLSYNDLAGFDSSKIDSMLDKAAAMNLNTVFVHARAFSDAFYKSDLFPWSHKLTGVQGQAPAVDPLQYIITASHKRGLRVQAWINPYRISTSTELTNSLAPNNPAVKWLGDPGRVIHYEANDQECLIYNPASQDVRNLITAGVVEIVNNYDIDGIHFDDYFYVTGTGEGIDTATKENEVNKLVRQVYAAVKAANPALSFGISPAGNISNCNAAGADVQTWLSQDGYVDYVCPQIYWTNEYTNPNYQFDNCLNDWLAMKQNPNVKLYVGLALYRVGTSSKSDPGWVDRNDNLMTQVQSIRSTGQCSGFILFDISNLIEPEAQTELANLKTVL